MAVIATVIGVILLAAAWRAGPWLAAHDRRCWMTAVACLSVTGAWFAGYELTQVALQLIPWDDAIFFERLPLYVAIVLLLSISLPRLDRRVMRVAVATIGAIFSLYAVAEVAAPLPLPLFADQLSAQTEGPAEVTQSTGWSCGAAALAWTVRLHGIPASERQMARLAVTAPLRGTSTRGMLRALHRVGLRAHAVKPATWAEIADASKPAIIGWKLSASVAHSVLLLGIDEDEVIIGDPLSGQITYSKQDFLDRWMRDLIVVRPPG
ncbi:MAG: cysteine peptidase family C39 domain-containing protein [Armatimonadota bacterium]